MSNMQCITLKSRKLSVDCMLIDLFHDLRVFRAWSKQILLPWGCVILITAAYILNLIKLPILAKKICKNYLRLSYLKLHLEKEFQ